MSSCVRAQAAVEALRLGLSNRHVIQHVSYGRDSEIATLHGAIEANESGSCQAVVGGYGVGKSHLCELLALHLRQSGYAVANVELGSAHSRAENPADVLKLITRNLEVEYEGRIIRSEQLETLRSAIFRPSPTTAYNRMVGEIHDLRPGPKKVLRRMDMIRIYSPIREHNTRRKFVYPKLTAEIPQFMTAINLAVAEVNKLAHRLRGMGFKGLVILFDEAERASWAWNQYQLDRCYDTILGFATASANKPTSNLKHYRDNKDYPYLPNSPSLIHTLFFFTHDHSMSYHACKKSAINAIRLQKLSKSHLQEIERKILGLYADAYGGADLGADTRAHLASGSAGIATEEIRAQIRSLVAALDYERLSSGQ